MNMGDVGNRYDIIIAETFNNISKIVFMLDIILKQGVDK